MHPAPRTVGVMSNHQSQTSVTTIAPVRPGRFRQLREDLAKPADEAPLHAVAITGLLPTFAVVGLVLGAIALS